MSKPKQLTFEGHLKAFTRSIKASVVHALACATLSLQHFHDHGDTSKCMAFYNAMPDNFVRKTAYVKWLMAHAPIIWDGKQLVKDKTDDAVKFNLEAALAKPFWEFAPDQELKELSNEDAYKRLMAAIKYFRSDKVKIDEPTKRMVDSVEVAIKEAHAQAQRVAAPLPAPAANVA